MYACFGGKLFPITVKGIFNCLGLALTRIVVSKQDTFDRTAKVGGGVYFMKPALGRYYIVAKRLRVYPVP